MQLFMNITSNIITLKFLLLYLILNIAGSITNESVLLSVYKKGCVIELRFLNKTHRNVELPNFVSLCTDTLNSYKVLPSEIIFVENDTLVLRTFHIETGTLISFRKKGLTIPDQNDSGKITVRVVSHVLLFRHENVQIVRLPTSFCDIPFKYCKIEIDGKKFVIGTVTSR